MQDFLHSLRSQVHSLACRDLSNRRVVEKVEIKYQDIPVGMLAAQISDRALANRPQLRCQEVFVYLKILVALMTLGCMPGLGKGRCAIGALPTALGFKLVTYDRSGGHGKVGQPLGLGGSRKGPHYGAVIGNQPQHHALEKVSFLDHGG